MTGLSVLFSIAAITVCALALMALEAFIPGVSFAGIAGLALIAGGAYMCWKAFGAFAAVLLLVGFGVLSFVVMRWIYRSMKTGKLSKSGIFLSEGGMPVVQTVNRTVRMKQGEIGVAKTALRPAGIAEFDGERIHVTAADGFIEAGECVCVVRVEGSRVFVEAVPGKIAT